MQILLLLAVILMSCGARDTELSVPLSAGSEWRLVSRQMATADQIAPGAPELGLKEAINARYSGPGNPDVTMHRMTSESGAFEMVQKWRPVHGALASHKGAIFFVARSEALDARELNRFLSQYESALR
jgi:hypothetical protein